MSQICKFNPPDTWSDERREAFEKVVLLRVALDKAKKNLRRTTKKGKWYWACEIQQITGEIETLMADLRPKLV